MLACIVSGAAMKGEVLDGAADDPTERERSVVGMLGTGSLKLKAKVVSSAGSEGA